MFDRFREQRTAAKCFARMGLYSKRRPASVRAVGVLLHPPSVTDAWYAADCPPRLDRRALSLGDRVVWRVSRVLRGCPGRSAR